MKISENVPSPSTSVVIAQFAAHHRINGKSTYVICQQQIHAQRVAAVYGKPRELTAYREHHDQTRQQKRRRAEVAAPLFFQVPEPLERVKDHIAGIA